MIIMWQIRITAIIIPENTWSTSCFPPSQRIQENIHKSAGLFIRTKPKIIPQPKTHFFGIYVTIKFWNVNGVLLLEYHHYWIFSVTGIPMFQEALGHLSELGLAAAYHGPRDLNKPCVETWSGIQLIGWSFWWSLLKCKFWLLVLYIIFHIMSLVNLRIGVFYLFLLA